MERQDQKAQKENIKMKITVKRSGGYANISMPPKVFETEDKEIIEAVNIISSQRYNIEGFMNDGMQYDFTIEENSGPKHFSIKENEDPMFQKVIEAVMGGPKS